MKILICDDSITVRKKLTLVLKKIHECKIFEANNGENGIEMYCDCKPDMVFMDIMMPEKDGLEAVVELVEKDPDAYIVMLSSVGTKSNLQKALKAGAVDFIQKPWDEDQLRVVLERYLDRG